ncbi:hypothetical protein EHS25_000898 [Saitozyma podzolica]|uniref:Uncharacterized protein n=1 Tax=Saitozyma podzolica TaxID=1890683 RepID=A0A427YXJ8_9TREE|nr:hypothetical protein EHS25_000898 [Saitozyma podzolica]
MRLEEEHPNSGVPMTSPEYAPTQLLAGPPTDPAPNNELFMLGSIASQDDELLVFLSLDIPMPGVQDWGFDDQDFNMFEPPHITGSGNGKGSWRNSPLADFAVGFGWCGVNLSVPRGLGVGGVEKKGYLTREWGDRGRTASMASRWRSRMGSQMLRSG